MKATLVSNPCGDWEALYIDGESVEQCHKFSPMELLELAEEYGFNHSSLKVFEMSDRDEEEGFKHGGFPDRLDQFLDPPTEN